MTLKKPDLQTYLDFTIQIAQKAGELLMSYQTKKLKISYKEHDKKNLVTEADKASENLIVKAIKKNFPNHCVLSEEGGDCGLKPSPYRWIIDPIDGTTNFAHSFPFFAISIGLEIEGELSVGVIYAPMLKELFSAAKGEGAFLNGKKINVSTTPSIDKALLTTGFNSDRITSNIPIFQKILPEVRGIRRAGSAAMDLAYIAAGRLDGYWELALYPWDIAAGILLIQEAGGKVTSIDGGKMVFHEGKTINMLATNKKIHRELQDKIAAAR